MPSAEAYAPQVEKEHLWLPRLASELPLSIPVPLTIGEPADGYPFNWSIYRWLDGDTATPERIANLCDFATSLAQFLIALQRIDPAGGPAPGSHNFFRGEPLAAYDTETRQANLALRGKIDARAVTDVWEAALATEWRQPPAWIHGDVSLGNLVVQQGRLSSVIDFGQLAVGDPACDLALAWTLFEGDSREAFRSTLALALDAGTWARGRGWTLWKALIVAAGLTETNAIETANCWRTIDEVISDHKREA